MSTKRNQLRAELRGHLVKVLEERGISASSNLLTSPWERATAARPKHVDPSQEISYATTQSAGKTSLQPLKRDQEVEGLSAGEDMKESAWYERSDRSSSNGGRRQMSREEHLAILRRQIEEARQRKEMEAKKQAEEDAMWEAWASRPGPLSNPEYTPSAAEPKVLDDWQVLFYRNQKRIASLERESASILRQLENLHEEQARIRRLTGQIAETQESTARSGEVSRSDSLTAGKPLEERSDTQNRVASHLRSPQSIKSDKINESSMIKQQFQQPVQQQKPKVLDNPALATTEAPMLPLPKTAQYFVYVAKSGVAIPAESPSTSVDTGSGPASPARVPGLISAKLSPARMASPPIDERDETGSVFEEPSLHQPLQLGRDDDEPPRPYRRNVTHDDDDSDDDSDDYEEDLTSQAARDALKRADMSSGDEAGGHARKKMGRQPPTINSYLDADMEHTVRGSPYSNSKYSVSSFDM